MHGNSPGVWDPSKGIANQDDRTGSQSVEMIQNIVCPHSYIFLLGWTVLFPLPQNCILVKLIDFLKPYLVLDKLPTLEVSL